MVGHFHTWASLKTLLLFPSGGDIRGGNEKFRVFRDAHIKQY
jgi:hypothetical protein